MTTDSSPSGPDEPAGGTGAPAQSTGAAPDSKSETTSRIKQLTDPARDAPEDTEDPDNSARAVHQTSETLVNVVGNNTVIYASSEGSRPPLTGRIDEATVAEALSVFAAPPAFDQARAVLAKYGIVVLVGAEGTGRYLAALALLADWPRLNLPKPIVNYVPTTTLGDLTRIIDRKATDGRYLLHDMRGDGRPSAEQRFTLTRLKDTLPRVGARLVVTADRYAVAKTDFGELFVEWQPPPASAVFDAHIAHSGVVLEPEDLEQAREHASRLETPARVAAFVARIATDGLTEAMNSRVEADRAAVRDWFSEQGRALADEVAVAAACFLHGVPERIFERCLSRLHELVRAYDQEKRAPRQEALTLSRAREMWTGGDGLLSMVEGEGRFAERRIGFRSNAMRQQAINEIWDRYGYSLLQPLRDWLDELMRDPSLDVHAQAVIGLALLAERRWPEVKDSFLNPWSDGEFPYRLAAATVLAVMSGSELLAPIALETALDWAENRGARRASTAALALGSPLGLRYQDRAFEELWNLTRHARGVRTAANIGLACLLAWAARPETADGRDLPSESEEAAALQRASRILKITCRAVAWTTQRGRGLDRRHALDAVVTMLGATRFITGELVVVAVLRALPAAADVVGELLAAVLESGPHHHASVDLLRELLKQLSEQEGSMSLAQQLGLAVFRRWTPEARSVLVAQIARELAKPANERSGPLLGDVRPRDGGRTGGVTATPEVTRRVIRSFVECLGVV
jgi:hypothetical protein